MSLEIGIIGLANVGKSTLFNAITNIGVLSANYPFATIEPNIGVVDVPDKRLDVLAKIYESNLIIPATVRFTDIAGLVKGASNGDGLGNKFLANIRECEAICEVVRSFSDKDIIRVGSSEKEDIEIVATELALADISMLERRANRIAKEAKMDKTRAEELSYIRHTINQLRRGEPIDEPAPDCFELVLLSTKPRIYIFNMDESSYCDASRKEALASLIAPCKSIFIIAKLEEELSNMSVVDKKEFLESYGVYNDGLTLLVQAAYDILGLQSYITASKKDIRAWPIKKGTKAPQAAGRIHSDFERGFISAQVMDYEVLVSYGSEQSVRAAGKIRTEGKDYIMQPNDVADFCFNTPH